MTQHKAPAFHVEIDFGVAGRQWAGDPADLLRVDPERIEEQAAEHPALFVWFGVLAVDARAAVRDLEAEKKRLRGKRDAEVRAAFARDKKKSTEKQIEAELDASPELIKQADELSDAIRRLEILEAFCEALRQRRYLLSNICELRRSSEAPVRRSQTTVQAAPRRVGG